MSCLSILRIQSILDELNELNELKLALEALGAERRWDSALCYCLFYFECLRGCMARGDPSARSLMRIRRTSPIKG
jgi:hypothetical protein